MGSSDDLNLLVHNSHKKQFGLRGKIGMRGVAIPPAGLMQEVVAERTQMMEAKKRDNEVKPVIDPKKRKDPVLIVPLDPDQSDYVFGPMRGVTEDKRRREKGEKRVRGTREEVLRMVFEKFQERPYWTLKALGIATQQPEVSIFSFQKTHANKKP